jgi:hypothetical protein
MGPTGMPDHISIDFREALDPGRGWIVGVAEKPARVELLAFQQPLTDAGRTISASPIDSALVGGALDGLPPRPRPVASIAASSLSPPLTADDSACTCPEFCERDHDNE